MEVLFVVGALPDAVVLLVGLVVVLLRRRRLGRIAVPAVAALAMMAVALVVDTVQAVHMFWSIRHGIFPWVDTSPWSAPVDTVVDLLQLVGLPLLVLSLFLGRRRRVVDRPVPADPADPRVDLGQVTP